MAKTFIVETSARHVHLSEADFKVLFGENATLTKKKDYLNLDNMLVKKELLLKEQKKIFLVYQF